MITNKVPTLVTSDNLKYTLIARGFIVIADSETLSAGVWLRPGNDFKLSVGNDTVLFDINSELAADLVHDLKAPFFLARLDEMRLQVTDRMRWLAAVNAVTTQHTPAAFVSYLVGDEHVSVEVGFDADVGDCFRVHNYGAGDLWSMPAHEAARSLMSDLVPLPRQ